MKWFVIFIICDRQLNVRELLLKKNSKNLTVWKVGVWNRRHWTYDKILAKNGQIFHSIIFINNLF